MNLTSFRYSSKFGHRVKTLTTFLREDRKRGFDFNTPPLMRCALFKINTQLYPFVWTFHHSIIDGRASSLVLYEALLNGDEMPTETAVSYQKYIVGKTADWQRWTGLHMPQSGLYLVDGGLTPVKVNVEKDLGVYFEPNVWMVATLGANAPHRQKVANDRDPLSAQGQGRCRES